MTVRCPKNVDGGNGEIFANERAVVQSRSDKHSEQVQYRDVRVKYTGTFRVQILISQSEYIEIIEIADNATVYHFFETSR